MNVSTQLMLLALLLTVSLSTSAAESHSHVKPVQAFKEISPYSCSLIQYSAICRNYQLAPDDKLTLNELKEGCESMPEAKFSTGPCPSDRSVSQCVDIIRDHHNPGVVYGNVYYSTDKKSWSPQEVERVCRDLEGTYVAIKTSTAK